MAGFQGFLRLSFLVRTNFRPARETGGWDGGGGEEGVVGGSKN